MLFLQLYPDTLLATASENGIIKIFRFKFQLNYELLFSLKKNSYTYNQIYKKKIITLIITKFSKKQTYTLHTCIKEIQAHRGYVTSMIIFKHINNKSIISCGGDDFINMYSIPKGSNEMSIKVREKVKEIIQLTKFDIPVIIFKYFLGEFFLLELETGRTAFLGNLLNNYENPKLIQIDALYNNSSIFGAYSKNKILIIALKHSNNNLSQNKYMVKENSKLFLKKKLNHALLLLGILKI